MTIIGAGASGLTAAIAAAQVARLEAPQLRIRLFEKDDRVGRSILATGNGRCNFSNATIKTQEYHHAQFVESVYASQALTSLSGDGCDAVHVFFQDLGLVWREENDGRQFPLANKASVVLDVLRTRVSELGVSIECDFDVEAVEAPGDRTNRFMLRMRDGRIEYSDSVIVACGGHNASALHIDFVSISNPIPVLGPLSVSSREKSFARELDNIRARVEVSLWRRQNPITGVSPHEQMIATEIGEIMFRKYGVSGICVFNLSRFAQQGDIVRINFLHALQEDPKQFLRSRYQILVAQKQDELTYEDMLRGLVLPRIAEVLLKRQEIELQEVFTVDAIEDLARLLSCCEFEIEGIADADLCQVQRGGLSVDAFKPETLQARVVPGFFAAGEAMDVDGPCGGYNLNWAWSSGLVAGSSAARYLVSQL